MTIADIERESQEWLQGIKSFVGKSAYEAAEATLDGFIWHLINKAEKST